MLHQESRRFSLIQSLGYHKHFLRWGPMQNLALGSFENYQGISSRHRRQSHSNFPTSIYVLIALPLINFPQGDPKAERVDVRFPR